MSTTNPTNINNDGLQAFTASTGQFANVELTTKGDILSRSSSVYVRQGVGADAEALVCDSAETSGLNYATVSSGSSVTFLGTQSASSSSSIDFTSEFDDATYLYYLITYTNVRPATDGADFRVRLSVDAGVSYETSGYRWVRLRLSSGSGSDSLSENNSDSKINVMTSLGNSAGEGIAGKLLYFPTPSPSSTNPGTLMYDNNLIRDTGTYYRNFGGGMLDTNSVVDGIRFYMSTGNIAVGDFYMYGVSKS